MTTLFALTVVLIALLILSKPRFMIDLTCRNNVVSSKKVFYCIAGVTCTISLLWITYKDTMEDWAYITLYSIYLSVVGAFEVAPKMLAMVLEFKNGQSPSTTTITTTNETKKEVS